MDNKTYDILKYIAQVVLPAIGTLYFALASIWGLPYGEQIVGTITAIDTFLGAILMISSSNYKKEQEAIKFKMMDVFTKSEDDESEDGDGDA